MQPPDTDAVNLQADADKTPANHLWFLPLTCRYYRSYLWHPVIQGPTVFNYTYKRRKDEPIVAHLHVKAGCIVKAHGSPSSPPIFLIELHVCLISTWLALSTDNYPLSWLSCQPFHLKLPKEEFWAVPMLDCPQHRLIAYRHKQHGLL